MLLLFTLVTALNITHGPWNLTCISTSNATLSNNLVTQIPKCIIANFSWYPIYMWVIIIMSLFFIFSFIKNRTRLIVVSFFGLVIGWTMAEYNFSDGYIVPVISTALFAVTLFYVWIFD